MVNSQLVTTHAERIIILLAVILFLIPTIVATLTYPGFYEDEPWVFLAALEAARGNGFSLGALGEGQSPMLVFGMLMAPLVWISPFDANITIRLLAALFCLEVLWFAYLIAAKLGARQAYLAPVFIIALPIVYLTLRYGRPEVFALAFGFSSIFAALSDRFILAGFLSAMAVCIHPLLIWIGLPCLLAALANNKRRVLPLYVCGGIMGLLPQVLWNSFVAPTMDKYMVSSSITSSRFAVLESILREPDRYTMYVAQLTSIEITVHIVLIVLAIVGIAQSRGWIRWITASIALGPLFALAAFTLMKNPYYFVGALPAIGLVAAIGASRLPRSASVILGVIALIYTGITHIPAVLKSRTIPSVKNLNDELSRMLPYEAVVFAPMREAALIINRPDIQFYSFHTFAPAESWEMPACSEINNRIHEIISADRRHENRTTALSDSVFLVMYGMSWPDYLALIYGPGSKEALKCLWDAPGIKINTMDFCSDNQCEVLDVRQRQLY